MELINISQCQIPSNFVRQEDSYFISMDGRTVLYCYKSRMKCEFIRTPRSVLLQLYAPVA